MLQHRDRKAPTRNWTSITNTRSRAAQLQWRIVGLCWAQASAALGKFHIHGPHGTVHPDYMTVSTVADVPVRGRGAGQEATLPLDVLRRSSTLVILSLIHI